MKRKMNCVKAFVAAFLLVLLIAAAGCGEEYSVTIRDGEETTEMTVTSGKKVQKILDEAGFTLGDKDEVSPELTERIREDTEIVISRYAAVTVVGVDGTEYPVECVGGTVADAIEEAGITLADGQSPDAEEDAYLTDGMTITIIQAPKVTLTVDGQSQEIYTYAETVEAFLQEQSVTLGENDRVTPELTTAVTDGLSVVVQRVEIKEEVVTEEIAFSSETETSSSLASGKTETKQAGENGSKDVTYSVTYVDGVEESRTAVSETVTKEPVTEIIVQGTAKSSKKSSSSSSSSSGSSSGGKTVQSVEYNDDCDGSGHGYKVITYSDGSQEIVEY